MYVMSEIETLPLTRKILGLLPLLLLASCSPGQEHFGGGPATFASNGERIYFSGTSASGQAIIASGGSSMMSRHRQMHGGGCAVCHGAEREGPKHCSQTNTNTKVTPITATTTPNHYEWPSPQE
jgi:cytochrome c553